MRHAGFQVGGGSHALHLPRWKAALWQWVEPHIQWVTAITFRDQNWSEEMNRLACRDGPLVTAAG